MILSRVMSSFLLNEKLLHYKNVIELPLSTVLLNSTELPWVFLVPRRMNIVQMNQLEINDQLQLMKEISWMSNIMENLFPCDRLNVAAIGNKTPQLHVHIICRSENDGYWPETVWQYQCQKLSDDEYIRRHEQLQTLCNLRSEDIVSF